MWNTLSFVKPRYHISINMDKINHRQFHYTVYFFDCSLFWKVQWAQSIVSLTSMWNLCIDCYSYSSCQPLSKKCFNVYNSTFAYFCRFISCYFQQASKHSQAHLQYHCWKRDWSTKYGLFSAVLVTIVPVLTSYGIICHILICGFLPDLRAHAIHASQYERLTLKC